MRSAGAALLPATAAFAAEPNKLAHVQPIIASFAGYEFEVGPMVAGLLACFAVRFYVSKTEAAHKWTVDAPVTAVALFFTAAVIQATRPIPLYALAWGTGLGAFGVGIINVALSFVRRNLGAFGDDAGDAGVPKPPTT